jgi:hypothetical protein
MELTKALVVQTAAASAEKSGPQVRQEGSRAADWFGANGGLEPGVMAANRTAFLDAFAPAGETEKEKKKRQHWNWVAEKLKDAAELLQIRTRYATQAKARTRIIDNLIPNSPLDMAIQRLLKAASSPDQWRVARCNLSVWLTFLQGRDISPEDATLVEIERFRVWLDEVQPNGKPRRSQSKQVLVPARKLTALLRPAHGWALD